MSPGPGVRCILHNVSLKLQNLLQKSKKKKPQTLTSKHLFSYRKWWIMTTNKENTDSVHFSLKWFYYKVHEDLQYYKRICQHAETEQSRTQDLTNW